MHMIHYIRMASLLNNSKVTINEKREDQGVKEVDERIPYEHKICTKTHVFF